MSYVTSSALPGRLQDSRAGVDAEIPTGYRPRMDWYDALKAWQARKLSAEEVIRIAEVTDIWELWELALGAGIDIKLGDRDHIENVVHAKRQIERGEHVDIIDLKLEIDLLVAGITEAELKARLRLKWIPTWEGFVLERLDDYERYLEMTYGDQREALRGMSDDDRDLYETLTISRALYRAPDE